MKPVTVLIADDHPLFRTGLRTALSLLPGVELLGEAADGAEALRQIRNLKPDVLILDLGMPKMDGLEVLRRLRLGQVKIKVLVLTARDDRPYLRAVVRAGARGYLLKDASSRELASALRAVAAGRTYFSRLAAQRLLDDIVETQETGTTSARLTSREFEVLSLIASGLKNRQAATKLGIGVRTVESHRETIMQKLGLRGAAALARYALENGLLCPSEGCPLRRAP
jgi:DNA-binding NarL/FixJ family response regulator